MVKQAKQRGCVCAIIIMILAPTLMGAAMSKSFWPWGLRLGGGSTGQKANVEYTGRSAAIPSEMQYGGILTFDGVDDYVDTDCELVDGDDYTMAVTFKNTGAEYNACVLANYYTRGLSSKGDGRIFVTINTDATTYTSSAVGSGVGDSLSRVIVSIADNGDNTITVSQYADGQLLLSEVVSGSTNKLTGDTYRIGAQQDSVDKLFTGQLSNVQIWNSAFTAADVAYDYANQSTTADTNPSTALTAANLKGYWKLDEKWGYTAEDSSAEGNAGTLEGFGDTRIYTRLKDKGKSPKDDSIVYSGAALDFDGVDDYVAVGDIS